MRLRDTLMLRFDRNTLLAAALLGWVIAVVVGVVIFAPDLSETQMEVVFVVVVGAPVVAALLVSHLRGGRRAPAPTAVTHAQIPDPTDVPKVEPATAPGQPTDSFAGELERLGDLHERGVLTDEEFRQAKQSVLRPLGEADSGMSAPSGEWMESKEDVMTKTPTVIHETAECNRCGRRRQVLTTRVVTGAGKIVASQSRCVDEQDCDEFVATMKQG